jgi:hypothetical protein
MREGEREGEMRLHIALLLSLASMTLFFLDSKTRMMCVDDESNPTMGRVLSGATHIVWDDRPCLISRIESTT